MDCWALSVRGKTDEPACISVETSIDKARASESRAEWQPSECPIVVRSDVDSCRQRAKGKPRKFTTKRIEAHVQQLSYMVKSPSVETTATAKEEILPCLPPEWEVESRKALQRENIEKVTWVGRMAWEGICA